MDSNAAELEQLGLTLSGRDPSAVDQADLASYVIWISQFAAQTNQIMATWGVTLIGYLDGYLRTVGMTPPAWWTFPQSGEPAADVGASTARPSRWWRRS
jgi:hypothetical protein